MLKKKEAVRALSVARTVGSTLVRTSLEAAQQKIIKLKEGEALVSQAALRLAKGLDELKGAAMKVGQILSMFDESTLPPGWKEALSHLQSQATPKSWSEIEPILREEIPYLSDDFAWIDPEAVHAASIGQVHKGSLKDGTQVALKIQYPNLEKSIDSDLKNMKRLVKLANILPLTGSYDHVFTALERMFTQELDFIREKKFYELYREKFKDHQGIFVPKTIEKFCTKKVLTTEWVEAKSLQKWIEDHSNKEKEEPNHSTERDRLGALLLDTVFTEILQLYHIQSDPNPGNFLVTPENKLVLLDFGATQELSKNIVQNYGELCLATLTGEEEKIRAAGIKIGILLAQDSNAAGESFVNVMRTAMEPFLQPTYTWQGCQLLKRINEASFQFMRHTKFRAPDAEILFMNRRLAGNLLTMEKLGPHLPARDLFLRIFKGSFSCSS